MTNFFDKNFPWDVTEHVRKFQTFLNSSWPSLDVLMEWHDWDADMSFIDDWIQVNWELLVERELLGKDRTLTPLCLRTSRMTQKGKKPTHSVIAIAYKSIYDKQSGMLIPNEIRLELFGFCTALKEGSFGLYPPFDIVTLVSPRKEFFKAQLSDVTFYLVELKKGVS